jgi:hypothetical protein
MNTWTFSSTDRRCRNHLAWGNGLPLPNHWSGALRNIWNAYLFFKEHAGYVVGERAKGALKLAKAERRANALGFVHVWEHDPDTDLGDHELWCSLARARKAYAEGRPVDADGATDGRAWRLDPKHSCEHETEQCVVYAEDDTERENPLASLGGIIDASSAYRRVVEAELSLEALGEYDERVARVVARGEADGVARKEARELYGDDNVTIEDDADVRRSEDGSIRVQAWLRLPGKEH